MDKLLQEMTVLAIRHHAIKLCLFGSRARGDYRAESDYDFALWGVPLSEQSLLRDEAEETIHSLLKLDLVFVSDATDQALLDNINKDGVVLMDRFEKKYENYSNAVVRLREGLTEYETTPSKIIRDGVIQRFEFTCELAWKTAREYLLEQGYVDLNSPKSVMKQAFAAGLVSDSDGWVSLLTDRNLTSHIYDETTADQIFEKVKLSYVGLFQALLDQMK